MCSSKSKHVEGSNTWKECLHPLWVTAFTELRVLASRGGETRADVFRPPRPVLPRGQRFPRFLSDPSASHYPRLHVYIWVWSRCTSEPVCQGFHTIWYQPSSAHPEPDGLVRPPPGGHGMFPALWLQMLPREWTLVPHEDKIHFPACLPWRVDTPPSDFGRFGQASHEADRAPLPPALGSSARVPAASAAVLRVLFLTPGGRSGISPV